jgi:hypothetical protein
VCVCVHAETYKVLPEWFAFHKLAWFQIIFLLVKFLCSKIMGVVHHKENSTYYRCLETFQKNILQNLVPSTVELFHVHTQRWRSDRCAEMQVVCVICLTVHIQLTSGSAFISRNVVGTGSSSTSASETALTCTFMA